MNLKKTVLGITILVSVISVPIVSKFLAGSEKTAVQVAELTHRVIRPSILASGKLAHAEQVKLSSEVIGKVVDIFVEEGDSVTAGQLLLKVDDQTFVAALEQKQAQVRIDSIDIDRQKSKIANLERQWRRKEALYQQKLLSDDEYDTAAYQLSQARIDFKSSVERLQQAKAQLEQARDQLSKTQIKSPISGIVTSLDIKKGETAIASSTNIPGSSLMTIANPDSIYTEVLVDEADVATVAIGQQAEIISIAYPDTPITGKVGFIANSAKVAEGRQGLSFTVRIHITDRNGVVLRPGMSSRAEIFSGDDKEVPTVPIQAIVFEEDRTQGRADNYIFIDNNGVAAKTFVEVGISDDEYQHIITRLDPRAQIVIGPNRELRHLKDGDPISIKADG